MVKLAAGESVVLVIPRVLDNDASANDEAMVIVSLTPRIVVQSE